MKMKQFKVVLGSTEFDPVYVIAARSELAATIAACHRFGIHTLEVIQERGVTVTEMEVVDSDFLDWAAGDSYCNDSLFGINDQAWSYSDYLEDERESSAWEDLSK